MSEHSTVVASHPVNAHRVFKEALKKRVISNSCLFLRHSHLPLEEPIMPYHLRAEAVSLLFNDGVCSINKTATLLRLTRLFSSRLQAVIKFFPDAKHQLNML